MHTTVFYAPPSPFMEMWATRNIHFAPPTLWQLWVRGEHPFCRRKFACRNMHVFDLEIHSGLAYNINIRNVFWCVFGFVALLKAQCECQHIPIPLICPTFPSISQRMHFEGATIRFRWSSVNNVNVHTDFGFEWIFDISKKSRRCICRYKLLRRLEKCLLVATRKTWTVSTSCLCVFVSV